MQSCSLRGIVDLQSYPLTDQNVSGREYKDLVERLRDELQQNGIVLLPNFMTKSGLTQTLQSLRDSDVIPYRKDIIHNVYLEDLVNEEEFPDEDHPKRMNFRSCKTCYCNDQIDSSSPLSILFHSDEMTNFIRDVLGKEELYRNADPLGALNVHKYEKGDELGWHFDRGEFAVNILLQTPESGGKFEFYPGIRSDHNPNYTKVKDILLATQKGQDLDQHGVKVALAEPGTLSIFCGNNSMHRVTKIGGKKPRFLAALSYEKKSGVLLNDYTKSKFYGRLK